MNVYQIMEEILNVVESSKEELVNKYVPNMKAERRHLDKETKKGKKLSKGLEKSADVSADIAKIAKKDVDKADDNYFNVRTNPNTTSDERNKAYKELKAAHAELIDWKRDEQKSREESKKAKAEAKEANKKRNELNKKIASLKGKSDLATDKAFEALELMEAIINEVSLKKWTETAKEVLPKREAELKDKEKTYMKSIGGNEENPKETWYKLTKGIGYPENKEYKEFKGSLERAKHAEKVSKLNKGSGSASANKVITAANKVVDKRYEKEGNNNHAFRAATLGNEDPVKSKVWKRAGEALEIMEQICDFADNLFELDYEEKQNISPNKISKVKKGKDGEKVEVVSVADELFPYEGDAKQQFNQKILAKINDMIEGTGTLEDLIQFVRKGVASKKTAHEGYEEAEGILETALDAIKGSDKPEEKKSELKSKLVKARGEERRLADEKAWKSYAKGDLKNPDVDVIRDPEFTKNSNGERKTRIRSGHYDKMGMMKYKPEWKQVEDSIKRHEKKVSEALDLMEEIINEVSDRLIRDCSNIKGKRSKVLSQVVDASKGQIEPDNKEGQEFIDTLDTFAKQDKHRSEVLKDKLGSRAETREKKKKEIDKPSE